MYRSHLQISRDRSTTGDVLGRKAEALARGDGSAEPAAAASTSQVASGVAGLGKRGKEHRPWQEVIEGFISVGRWRDRTGQTQEK